MRVKQSAINNRMLEQKEKETSIAVDVITRAKQQVASCAKPSKNVAFAHVTVLAGLHESTASVKDSFVGNT
jgi:hypothetical protein